VQIIRLSN